MNDFMNGFGEFMSVYPSLMMIMNYFFIWNEALVKRPWLRSAR